MSEAAQPRKRGPKPSGRRAVTVGVRLRPDEIVALDKLMAQNGSPITRSGLAACLIAESLEERGLLPKIS